MVGATTHPVMPNLVMLWKMSPAWQREAGGPYNPGKMAVAARSPEFSHPTEMPRDLAGWGSARRAPWRLPRASISRPQSRTSNPSDADQRSARQTERLPRSRSTRSLANCRAAVAGVLLAGGSLALHKVQAAVTSQAESPASEQERLFQ